MCPPFSNPGIFADVQPVPSAPGAECQRNGVRSSSNLSSVIYSGLKSKIRLFSSYLLITIPLRILKGGKCLPTSKDYRRDDRIIGGII